MLSNNVVGGTRKSGVLIKTLFAATVSALLVLTAISPALADDDVLTPVASYTAPSGNYGVKLDHHSSGGLQVTAWNNSGSPQSFGLASDLGAQGDMTNLWVLPINGFFDTFQITVNSGDTHVQDIPQWPGETYTFYADPAGSMRDLGVYTVPGHWLPLEFIGDGSDEFSTLHMGQSIRVGGTSDVATAAAGSSITVDGSVSGIEYDLITDLYAVPADKINNAFDSTTLLVDPHAAAGMKAFNASDAISLGSARVSQASIRKTVSLPDTLPAGNYALFFGNSTEQYYPVGPWDINQNYNLIVTAPGTTTTGSDIEVAHYTATGTQDVGFKFDNVATPGITTVQTTTTGPTPTGFTTLGATPTYYNLETTATFIGNVNVCVNFDTTGMTTAEASSQHLYHYTNNAWVDITKTSSFGQVCGDTPSFSPFAVGKPKAVVVTPAVKFVLPIKATGLNTAIAGLPYPVTFKADKTNTPAVGYPTTQQINCSTGAKMGAVTKTTALANAPLIYVPKLGTYSYVWNTSKTWKNTCRTFSLKLKDGSVGEVSFKLG